MSKKDEALKLALELKNSASAYWTEKEILIIEKLIKLLAQPEQPAEQTPVATLWQHGETGRTRITMPEDITDCDARWFKAADLYTSPPAQQKPVERGGLRFHTNGVERQHWKADGSIDFKDKQGNVTMTIAAGSITSPQPSKPLTDEQMFEMVEIAWRHGWASCRDAEYVGEEAEDERWGMVGAEVVQDIAAHGIKENT